MGYARRQPTAALLRTSGRSMRLPDKIFPWFDGGHFAVYEFEQGYELCVLSSTRYPGRFKISLNKAEGGAIDYRDGLTEGDVADLILRVEMFPTRSADIAPRIED